MVKKMLRRFARLLGKRSYTLRRYINAWRYNNHVRFYQKKCITQQTDDKLVLFESFFGRKFADSPKAIYLEMLNNPAYSDYRFVWVFREDGFEEKAKLVQNDRTTCVMYHTRASWLLYGKAKYWVLNSRVKDYIEKKPDQVFIQTWHGTPLKRLGFDIKKGNNAKHTKEELAHSYLQNAEKADYFISPSRFCTEVFTTAFGFDKLGVEHKLIETGYPRNDDLFRLTPEKIAAYKKELKLPEDKKVILYAPTWRDNEHEIGVGYTFDAKKHIEDLIKNLPEEYVIMVRLHYFVADEMDLTPYAGVAYDFSEYEDINVLYAVSDILITDYSSVFFDYANLHRPILFYMYDLDFYKNETRDFYIDLDELPGPILETQEEVINAIQDVEKVKAEYAEKYRKFNEKFNYLDDAEASKRVIERCIG
ncbi:MAG: CDP-glycerol glycerophosphotransferase family protein [Eubacterium sp.]|nr:CDP-glycerol glycerophosphotransferase family protein [Eubacterium sp.]